MIKNQQADPVIIYPYGNLNIPLATKDKLAAQLPFVKKRFTQYKDFAKVSSIKSLLGKNEEEILQTKQLNELRSMIFLNQNGDRFDNQTSPQLLNRVLLTLVSTNQMGISHLLAIQNPGWLSSEVV